ncbi:hypothetical protein VKT23_004102 [Stygiomarasmius scandens]|uniref:Uncharacterized protein n=1 Tax=Marasmiellus scandens TaxID=2682957 RepID=A0ABR1JTZ8_9AGAR
MRAAELLVVRDLLCQKLGPDFARSVYNNRDGYVSPRVLKALSVTTPTAAQLDAYLSQIAKAYGVTWVPEPRRQDMYALHTRIAMSGIDFRLLSD